MSTTEPTTEAGKLRARIEKDAQEINARANHFESLRVVNALAAFGLDACQAGIEATGRLTESEAALSQRDAELATVVEALRKLHDQVNAEQDIPCVGVSGGCRPAIILADLSTAATAHDERIRQAALSQFTPERIAALIRQIDGNHDMGAGELGDRLYAALTEKPQETPE